MKFLLEAECGKARAATLETLHGTVMTPVFMPVGTQATVKAQTVETLKDAGASVLLANTYHLMLRPGIEVFRQFGGIHKFMRWDRPVLTDSGGFQIFSLPHARSMSEEGARFQSYVDGSWHLLSPEKSIEVQRAIGSDIMMVLDQCVPSTAERKVAEEAMELTHRWAVRSLKARGDSPQALFGIVQGAAFEDLREKSASFITSLPLDGFAIGGLAVGESKAQREDLTEAAAAGLPRERPRYLMGVGTPVDIIEAVARGVDMFDCIIPTMLAQRGVIYTSEGRLSMRRGMYRLQRGPLDALCDCPVCARYDRAYLHHLIKAEEVLGWHLLGRHNLHFYKRMMENIRANILAGTYESFLREKREAWARTDGDDGSGERKPKARAPKRMQLGDYEVVDSGKGWCSVKQKSSGETMHSVSDPTEESRRLYVEQTRLAERLRETSSPPLVVWDVGLGAAHNAMAVVRCFEETLRARGVEHTRGMELVSFERDLDPLRLAQKFSGRFAHLHHSAPSTLLQKARWEDPSGLLRWTLHEGCFLEMMESAPAPDLVLYDPFSSKTDAPLWAHTVFERIVRACQGKETLLVTYSNSTAVRASLLWAGFFVGAGVATGPKSETTLAMTRAQGNLLGEAWLKRFEKSSAKFPASVEQAQWENFAERVRGHPQFSGKFTS